MEKEGKKPDRRVVRTKKAIRNSFVKLLAEKDLEKITVKEIADGADVDRKTVYNYYSGVYEILDELENELVHTFECALEKVDISTMDANGLFEALVELLKENMELYGLLMRIDSNSRLIAKMVVYLKEQIQLLLAWGSDMPQDKITIAAEYVTAGMFAAYRWWFNSERKQPVEEFTKDIASMVLSGMPSYLYNE